MNKPIIAVDVDLTVVDSLTPWFKWLRQYSDEPVWNRDNSYDLAPEMRAILDRAGYVNVDPLDFWRQNNLYHHMTPIEGCVDALRAAYKRGCEIVFVSSCFAEHTNSKAWMIKRHFPFASGFIATHDKHFVGYDMLIDDRLDHMRLGMKYRPQSDHILFVGIRADGSCEDRKGLEMLSDWSDFSVD